MYTLGINAVYHDSAACLVKDGQVIAAVEEEITRIGLRGRRRRNDPICELRQAVTLGSQSWS